MQAAAFADKSFVVLRATSATPLDGLEAGLLALQPFRFGGCADGSDRLSSFSSSSSITPSPAPSSPSSSSSSSTLSSLSSCSRPGSDQPEHGGGLGDDKAGTVGEDSVGDAGGRSGRDAGQSSGGAIVESRAGNISRRNERGSKGRPAAVAREGGGTPTSPPASVAEAPPGAAGAATRPDTSGGNVPSSPDRRGRGKLRLASPHARGCRRHGWVRGGSSIPSSGGARGRRSGSGGGGRSPTSAVAGCWVPPPTRWGGTPIKSAAFWGSWGEGSNADVAHAGQKGVDTSDGPRSRSSTRSPFGDYCGGGLGGQASEWGELEESQGGSREGLDAASEFFRTADGRSLFAESLGSLSGDGSAKRARREIRWGEGGDSDRRGGDRLGFLCLLGEESCCPSERGADKAKRLGVASRHRRARIDARSRDGKRRAETLLAREKIKRLEEEVGRR